VVANALEFLVTGGTGSLGSCVVDRLRGAGRGVRVFSRSGGDGGTETEDRRSSPTRRDGAGFPMLNAALQETTSSIHFALNIQGEVGVPRLDLIL
jgi:nucleoside-diphosphate-sugar epimerase